jgi:hypothetical protein
MFLEGLCFMAQTHTQVWRNLNRDGRIKAFKQTLSCLRQQGLQFAENLKKRICDLANKNASLKSFMDFICILHENVSVKSFMGFLLLNVLILNLL